MPTETAPLFTRFTLGSMELKNRVVMAPLTRSRSSEAGIVPDYAATYYTQGADAGLIVSEATNISAQGRGHAKTPGIWTAEQVEAWSAAMVGLPAASAWSRPSRTATGAPRRSYSPGEGRLPGLRWAGDLSGVCTGVVRIRGGLDGDHHRG